jgi:cbb3-type cytochrome oxidase maturation protein
MEILFLLIPLSVVLVFVIGVVFWWSLKHGQFEDLEGPAYRMLMDDDRPQIAAPRNGAGDDEAARPNDGGDSSAERQD